MNTFEYDVDGNVTMRRLDGSKISGINKDSRLWATQVQRHLDSGGTITAYTAPEIGYVKKRVASLADGGYGTVIEQLELFYDQVEASIEADLSNKIIDGLAMYHAHITAIKTKFPKTE